MKNLIGSENFEVIKVNVVVFQSASRKETLSGFALNDKRVNMLVNLNDEFFTCMKTKTSALLMIKDGLFNGFSHYKIEV